MQNYFQKSRNIMAILLACLLTACACNGDVEMTKAEAEVLDKYTVRFIDEFNSTASFITSVVSGDTVSMPRDPQKENHLFLGWYSNSSCTVKYDFSQPVTDDLILYASYVLDGSTTTNKISEQLINGVFTIYNKSYNKFLWFETKSSVSQGTAFCFKTSDDRCYLLTNCHVVNKKRGYKHQSFEVISANGTSYKAYLYNNAVSAEYDLACLYIDTPANSIVALDLADCDPSLGDDLIAVSTPIGQRNCISYGKVLGYSRINLSSTPKEESNVQFHVIRSDEFTQSGSSGGPVLNASLEVVGVHYAGSVETIPLDERNSYSIPIEKIREFLNNYVHS